MSATGGFCLRGEGARSRCASCDGGRSKQCRGTLSWRAPQATVRNRAASAAAREAGARARAAGLEYDLNLFNIVAVSDFNMGAMENKSLNVFNSRLVIASPATSSDLDFARVEGVVAHEYFHKCGPRAAGGAGGAAPGARGRGCGACTCAASEHLRQSP